MESKVKKYLLIGIIVASCGLVLSLIFFILPFFVLTESNVFRIVSLIIAILGLAAIFIGTKFIMKSFKTKNEIKAQEFNEETEKKLNEILDRKYKEAEEKKKRQS